VTLKYLLKGTDDTNILGKCLSESVRPGDILLLSGDLGAGKTFLTKAIASGLGIEEGEVTSPSFTIIHEHLNGRIPLIHADLYRLGRHTDITEIGLEEYLNGENLAVIEWADYLDGPLLEQGLRIDLRLIDEKAREAHITGEKTWHGRLLELDGCMKDSFKCYKPIILCMRPELTKNIR